MFSLVCKAICRHSIRLSILGFLFFLVIGCSDKPQKSHAQSCSDEFQKLHKQFEKGEYADIREPLNDLIIRCHGSIHLEKAMFNLAESYYKTGDWIEAQAEFKAFLREFPNSTQYGELAQYRLAEVAAQQSPIIPRDQTQTKIAIQSFEDFVEFYPNSSLVDSAKIQIENLYEKLARKQMRIARLYSRMGQPQAAVIYYKDILDEYPQIVNKKTILLKLADNYIELNQFDQAEEYLAKLDNVGEKDPLKQELKQTYARLEEAREDFRERKEKERKEKQGKEIL